MANSNIPTLGRFSSQILTNLGTQRTVKSVTGTPQNTFKYNDGKTVFPNPSSIQQSMLGAGVSGSYPADWYNNTRSYFLGRGATVMYAEAMTGLVIDMADSLGITPQAILEKEDITKKLILSPNAYRSFNMLRDPGNQVGVVTSVNNRYSLKAREIRA